MPHAIPLVLRCMLEDCALQRERSLDDLIRAYASKPPAMRELAMALHHHVRSETDRALQHASAALALAPGSRWLRAIPYFLIHPDGFDAPQPPFLLSVGGTIPESQSGIDPSLVDAWIEGISNRSSPMRPEESASDEDSSRDESFAGVGPADPEDMATETLAAILEGQGRFDEALRMLRRIADRTTQHDPAEIGRFEGGQKDGTDLHERIQRLEARVAGKDS